MYGEVGGDVSGISQPDAFACMICDWGSNKYLNAARKLLGCSATVLGYDLAKQVSESANMLEFWLKRSRFKRILF